MVSQAQRPNHLHGLGDAVDAGDAVVDDDPNPGICVEKRFFFLSFLLVSSATYSIGEGGSLCSAFTAPPPYERDESADDAVDDVDDEPVDTGVW